MFHIGKKRLTLVFRERCDKNQYINDPLHAPEIKDHEYPSTDMKDSALMKLSNASFSSLFLFLSMSADTKHCLEEEGVDYRRNVVPVTMTISFH